MARLIPVGLAVAAALAVLTGARDASAHARYEDSTPARGAILQDPPAHVEITFTQDIQRISGSYGIDVNLDRGASVTAGPSVVNDDDRAKLSVPLQPNLQPGRYVVNFRNVSDEDGDPFAGAFSFYYQVEPTAVDLANDEQLAMIGEEEPTPTPGGAETPESTVPPVPTGPASITSPTVAPADGGDEEDDGDDGAVLWIAIGLGVAAAVVAGGAVMVLRNRAR